MYTNTRLIIWRFLWIIPFILMTGCSSTKVLNTWQPENLEVKHIDKALIVGVAADDINRRLFEDSFASALNEKGAKAYTSYDIVSSDNKNQIEQFRNAAKQLGADSILVTHLVGTKTKEQYNPPITHSAPFPYYLSYGRYYPTVHDYVHTPGYYSTHEYVKLETNLYDVESEALLWSATTETVDPKDAKKEADKLSEVLVKQMKKDGLISSSTR